MKEAKVITCKLAKLRNREKFVFSQDPVRDLFVRGTYYPKESLYLVTRVRDDAQFCVSGKRDVLTRHEMQAYA